MKEWPFNIPEDELMEIVKEQLDELGIPYEEKKQQILLERRERCVGCIALVEHPECEYFCDELQKPCEDIEDCPEWGDDEEDEDSDDDDDTNWHIRIDPSDFE